MMPKAAPLLLVLLALAARAQAATDLSSLIANYTGGSGGGASSASVGLQYLSCYQKACPNYMKIVMVGVGGVRVGVPLPPPRRQTRPGSPSGAGWGGVGKPHSDGCTAAGSPLREPPSSRP